MSEQVAQALAERMRREHEERMTEPVEPFGFVVAMQGENWEVYLPHCCDEWLITYDGIYANGTPIALAIKQMTAFVAEAEAALDALKARRSMGKATR